MHKAIRLSSPAMERWDMGLTVRYLRDIFRAMQRTMRKEVAWLGVEIKTPPFSEDARKEAGELLGDLQEGRTPAMPHARPMPSIGARCLELRVQDKTVTWRILCRVDADAVIVAGVFPKKTEKTPRQEIETCRRRLAEWDRA